jgi:hypothetical protein
LCSHFPNTFSRGTVQKFRGTLVCRGTPFENPCFTLSEPRTVINIREKDQDAHFAHFISSPWLVTDGRVGDWTALKVRGEMLYKLRVEMTYSSWWTVTGSKHVQDNLKKNASWSYARINTPCTHNSRYCDWRRAGRSEDRIPVRRDFSHTSRPPLGPTQPPVQWKPGFSHG